ncbi:MalY/PatB family protein [Thalassobius sp. Cn5-15]|uniref:MalY/PatB family protein n=1 Tax=Thalassobius sp. Cn5-15 TaxID=2917763 RepID=UPI001EF299E5|nr:MalY/PatB family protein [Thalassobius sp. Cn5-15]MCG7493834.1 pyridoxal phosphate-dependent aminotransferase [Thalassobius sp. Cn5-15]
MSFDDIHNRVGTHSLKWDIMESLYGVSPEDGLSMWVADMDFKAAEPIQNALQSMLDHGILGYYGNDTSYRAAICWWMENRHGWTVDPAAIFTTHGLVNGTGVCVDAFTQEGDGVVLMTPVYHAFARVITAAGRRVVECDLRNDNGRYEMDFDAWDQQMDGSEKMLILCSPHNPGGRVWTRTELAGVLAFAKRHDLILVSDEIHHDLVFPGTTHIPMANIDGAEERLVMMTSPSKTFNIAGTHCGQVIIPDTTLRAQFGARMAALGLSPNAFGLHATEAAYSPEGAKWADAVLNYIDGNRKLFDEGINAIPGLTSMPMEATYLAWVDFSGTGMSMQDFTKRVEKDAKIAVNHGPSFGSGGDNFLRFNLATPRAHVEEAVKRMQAAFGDLQ